MTKDFSRQAVVIGAGVAGLSCAVRLSESGVPVTVLEATDRVGGRIRSDVVDGFTLDHGFQVLLTAYPACRELLDYDALRLCPFEPGALVRKAGRFVPLSDPWRRPLKSLATATSPVGTLGDKWRVGKLRRTARRGTLEELYERPHEPTVDRLRHLGFTGEFIDEFFRPFLGGVFLDPELRTSSRMLEFVFRMFASGDIALPADGMAAIPRQLADRLPRGTIRLKHSVEAIEEGVVRLTDGTSLRPQTIVVATESNAAARLLGVPALATPWRTAVTHYFAADRSPDPSRMLMLAGDEYGSPREDAGDGEPAHHLLASVTVLSDIAPTYAPPGKALISVSTLQPAEPGVSAGGLPPVLRQLGRWFGGTAAAWKHLRSYAVPYALPVQSLRNITPPTANGNIVLCGDYCETPSIQGAMNSGLRAAAYIKGAVG